MPTTSSASSTSQIMSDIEQIIMEYDLLQHRFYQAWNAGMLQHEDLKMYATVREAAQAMWNSLDGIYARCNVTAC